MITQKERRENRAKLFEEIQTLAQRAGDKDHTWSDDDEQEWNAANKRYEALTIEIEQKKKELENSGKEATKKKVPEADPNRYHR